MRTGDGRGGRGVSGRTGQGRGRDFGQGSSGLGLISFGLGLLSDVITRRQDGSARRKTQGTNDTNHLVAAVIMDKCCFCGECQQICPQNAITLGQILRIDAAKCTGCGQCVVHCPEEAIVLKRV